MYFLTDEEKKQLLKKYLPQSRQMEVAEELRGWNWHQPPLVPAYDIKLGIYEVANSYCPSNRDLYLRRVSRVKVPGSPSMVRGKIFHEVLVKTLVRAKKSIYQNGVANYAAVIKEINSPLQMDFIYKYRETLNEEDFNDALNKAEILASFENARITARMQEILVKQPYIGEDSLAALAIPVVLEQKLDGSFLGLSSNLSTDAFTYSEPMVVDLKFGEPRDFHRLSTTGYALVMEALHEFPVNLGCIVYCEFRNNRLIVKKDIHIIDDELRQWFVEQRDEKMRMIYEEIDPGRGECYDGCPYSSYCNGCDGSG